MNILEKLRECNVDIEIEAVVSMPIVNSIGEYIFVYYTKSNGSKDSYLLDKIKCIYVLPFDSDNIATKNANDFIPKSILERVSGAIIKPTVFGIEAMEKEEQCIRLYSKLIGLMGSKKDGSGRAELVNEYKHILFELIPSSVLREIYEFFIQI